MCDVVCGGAGVLSFVFNRGERDFRKFGRKGIRMNLFVRNNDGF